MDGGLDCWWRLFHCIFRISFFQEQSGQNNRAQLFMKFLEAVLEVYGKGTAGLPDKALQYRVTNTDTIKPGQLSSSSDDIRSLDGPSSLSSSLTSLPTAVKDLSVPMPFKRTGSSYRPRKISLGTKVKRNMSTKAVRSSSVQGIKFSWQYTWNFNMEISNKVPVPALGRNYEEVLAFFP